MSETIINQLKNIVAHQLDVNLSLEEIDENSSLFEDGLAIDSLAVIELISLTEEQFKIEFDEEDLSPENFSSLKVLSELINRKLSLTPNPSPATGEGVYNN